MEKNIVQTAMAGAVDSGDSQYGAFVGLWVASILAAGAVWMIAGARTT